MFTIHCKASDFDLSEKALYTGETDGDTFLLILKNINVGSKSLNCTEETIVSNKKYIESLRPATSVLAGTKAADKSKCHRLARHAD